MTFFQIKIFLLIFGFNFYLADVKAETKDLSGLWKLRSADNEYQLTGNVPGGVYSDLMNAKIIGDVFYGFNDTATRWVSKKDWIYSRHFTVSEWTTWRYNNIKLLCLGIDTFSKIYVNGKLIGTTDNMFVQYVFNLKPYLKIGINEIKVHLTSAVNKAKELFEEQAKEYPIGPLCVPDEYNGECHANHIRKMQASFSWDWGPALPSMGIWRHLLIESYNTTRIKDVTVNTVNNTSTDAWDVHFTVYFAANVDRLIEGNFHLKLDTNTGIRNVSEFVSITPNKDGEYQHDVKLSVPKAEVDLWWPNGYGEAKLYKVSVSYRGKIEEVTFVMKIGFRTVELMQDPLKSGRMFYFKVNRIPIYAKGSNSIPINILPERAQLSPTILFLLQSAKEANMNMLRVWGGGMYESNLFYNLADELGIMIWQDFMFACAMYPVNEEFLSSVRKEVRYQVRRLQYHPSIVLWAGSNENEAALRQNWYGTQSKFSLYKKDYKTLYVDTIEKEVLHVDPTRQYLVSSPTNGIKSIEEDYVAENPHSDFYGDVHYYNYYDDPWTGSTFPINRFASEYGYQALPSVETLFTATDSINDLKIDSKFMIHRQHLPLGYERLLILIDHHLKLPDESDENYYKGVIYYSQITQAMAVKVQTEYYRQWRSYQNWQGKGYNMGALYWQLNDVWVAPSWSSIDFQNKWKMLHYFAKRFFSPVIITGDLKNKEKLDLYVVSDLLQPIHNTTLAISVYQWDSFHPIYTAKQSITVDPNQSTRIKTYNLNSHPFYELCKGNLKNCFLYFTLQNNTTSVAPDNFIFPLPLKSLTLPKATVNISQVKSVSSTSLDVEVEASNIALFVWLEAKGIQGRFSDNGFLQVTPTRTIQFYALQPISVDTLRKSLSVIHLLDY